MEVPGMPADERGEINVADIEVGVALAAGDDAVDPWREEHRPGTTVRAIDSSWCEVETDDEDVLDHVRRTFADVRVSA
jgi:hypothetical protein